MSDYTRQFLSRDDEQQKQTVDHFGKPYGLVNGPLIKDRAYATGDGVQYESQSGSFYLAQPATGTRVSISGHASGYAINDMFTRSDDATSMGTPEIGYSSWSPQQGTFGITGNKAALFSPVTAGYDATLGPVNWAIVQSDVFDCRVGVTLSRDSGAIIGGLVFLASDTAPTFYAVQPNVLGTIYVLNSYTNGVKVQEASFTASPSSNDTIVVSISSSSAGAFATILVNSIQQYSHPLPVSYSAYTHHGIIASSVTGASFTSYIDNFATVAQKWDDFFVTTHASPTGSTNFSIDIPQGVRIEAPVFATGCEAGMGMIHSWLNASEKNGVEVHDALIEARYAGGVSAWNRFMFTTLGCDNEGQSYIQFDKNGLRVYKNGVLKVNIDGKTGDVSGLGGGGAGTAGATGPQGTSGTSGTGGSGTSGTSGTEGAQGTSGTSGTGTSGTSGNAAQQSGTSGTVGGTGSQGTSGTSGAEGTSGRSGTPGAEGASGRSGTVGTSGTSGESGTSGATGASSGSGTSGTSGNAAQQSGTSGTSGTQGSTGGTGAQGTSGTSGEQGTSGTSGNTGASSGSGTSGTSGTEGSAGSAGADGTSGTSGTSGTGTSGISGSGGSPGGSDGQIQYNDNGNFGGTSLGSYDDVNNRWNFGVYSNTGNFFNVTASGASGNIVNVSASGGMKFFSATSVAEASLSSTTKSEMTFVRNSTGSSPLGTSGFGTRWDWLMSMAGTASTSAFAMTVTWRNNTYAARAAIVSFWSNHGADPVEQLRFYYNGLTQGCYVLETIQSGVGFALKTQNGFLCTDTPDGGTTGGNSRGSFSVDWQGTRDSATEVASGTLTTIGGGARNLVSGDRGTVPGGESNSVTGAYSIATGSNAFARGYGSSMHAAGLFSTRGDAQHGIYVARNQTTGDVATELIFDGSTTSSNTTVRIVPTNQQAIALDILVVAKQSSSAIAKAWKLDGLVERLTSVSSCNLVAWSSKVIGQDASASAWEVALSADTTVNGAVRVYATGALSATIKWVATIRTAEVIS